MLDFSIIFAFYKKYWGFTSFIFGLLYLICVAYSAYLVYILNYSFPFLEYHILIWNILFVFIIATFIIQILHIQRFRREIGIKALQEDQEILDIAYGKGYFNFYCNSFATNSWIFLLALFILLSYFNFYIDPYITIPYIVSFTQNFLLIFGSMLFSFFLISNLLNVINLFYPIQKKEEL